MVSESFSQHWPLSGLHSVFSHLYLCMFHQCHLSLFPKEFMPVVFFIVIMWFNSLYINCWSVNTKKNVIFKKTLLNALGRFKRDVVQKKTTVYLVVFMTSVKTRRILHSNCFKISFHFKEPKTRNEIVQSRCQGDTTGWDLHNVFGLCQQISKRMCVHLFAGGVYVYTFFFLYLHNFWWLLPNQLFWLLTTLHFRQWWHLLPFQPQQCNPDIYSCIVNSDHTMEGAQLPIDWWMDKDDVVWTHNRISLNHPGEWNLAFCNSIDGASVYYTKWNKANIPHDLTHMWHLRKKTDENTGRGEKKKRREGNHKKLFCFWKFC